MTSEKDASLNSRIKWTWRLRFQGKIRDTETCLLACAKENPQNPEDRWQLELLRLSLLRAKGQLPESNAGLETLAAEITAAGSALPFQFYLQKAINLYAADQFSPALEFYLLADSVAADGNERLVCLMNILGCLDNLNLPWESTLKELEKISSEQTDSDFVGPVRKQLTAFYQRRAFRNGRFRELFAAPVGEEMDQSHFNRLWASRLPYVKTKLKDRDQLLQKLVLDNQFHAKSYRLQTLLADPRLQSSDKTAATTLQQVDRLYLWTWNWLADPSEVHRKSLAECLQAFDFTHALTKMTFEDFQMLQNALLWISVFQESLATWVDRYLEHFTVKDCTPFPIFEYEHLLVQWLKAKREGRPLQEWQKKIDRHPLSKSRELRMRDWAEGWAQSLGEKRAGPASPQTLQIFEETYQIRSRKKSLISKPLSQTLTALAEKKVLSFAEALWIGFEIAPYDHGIHGPKIYNCLARLKDLLPKGITIKTKDQMIFIEGRTDLLKRVSPLPLERKLLHDIFDFTKSAQSPMQLAFEKPLHPRMLLKKVSGKCVLSRQELQEAMAISKASTVRWIHKWQEQGLIQRQGVGRSARYLIEIAQNYRLTDLD